MKNQLLTLLTIILFTISASAQYTWSDIGTGVSEITISNGPVSGGTTTVGGVTNPNPSGINTTVTTNSFEKFASTTSYVKLSLSNPILEAEVPSTIIKVKLYFAEFDDLPNTSVKMFLRDTGNGNTNRKDVTLTFEEADEGLWKEYTFDFSSASGTFNADYDEIQLFFNLGNSTDTATYYFDGISGTKDQAFTLSPATSVLNAGGAFYLDNATAIYPSTAPTSSTGTYTSIIANAFPTGHTNANVSGFSKVSGVSANIKFTLDGFIQDQATNILKIRIYVPATIVGPSFRINLRKDGVDIASTQITHTESDIILGAWQEYTFDFSATAFKGGVLEYDQALLFFSDTSTGATDQYYIDSFQGPTLENATLAINSNELAASNLSIFPNPVTEGFEISATQNIKNVQIYSINGRLLKTLTPTTKYDISDLASGLYLATINTVSRSETIKILKK